MENSLAAKQKYLSIEILDKGFNSNNFLIFLGNKKTNGDNLNKWSMTELHQYVTEFQLLSKQSIIVPCEKYSNSIDTKIIGLKDSTLNSFNKQFSVNCNEPQILFNKTDFSQINNMKLILSLYDN